MRSVIVLFVCVFELTAIAEVPTSQPSADGIESMRREISDLKRENARLLAELARARGELAVMSSTESKPAAGRKRNWKEELKVGMTEAQADELFKRIPRLHGATMSQATRSELGGDRVVDWMQDPVDHAAGGIGSHAAITQAPLTRGSRMCTITFQSGIITAIAY